jgi:hypothetical protein
MKKKILSLIATLGVAILLPQVALAQETEAQEVEEAQEANYAEQLSNPVADLNIVPIQANYNENFGANDKGSSWRINVQPVIPIHLNKTWNVISPTCKSMDSNSLVMQV